MLKILGKSSSINVRKVLWLCEEAAISYEQQDYGSGFTSTQTAQFKALNPNGLVPVIVDDGFVLWESNTICRYLAGREQRDDLLPVAPRQRALVEKWMDWQATELNNAWRYAFMGLVRKSPAHSEQPAIAASIARWNALMGILEAQLAATGAYAAGETFTLADIVLGLSVNRWKMSPINRPAYPAIDQYYALLNQRTAFQRYGNNGEP
ncbi:glutathione S-transferase [Gibbsiella quercinecans]|uniref:Glutathione S-transferase n=1 Tax=Gibbsiella quercinecans TaxID=929813 RepID=A0A250AVK0_9GAMM|nr:glutathione S-transferase [Gibbsiella quercinecans]ATA18003.1 glutathione S-transferase [Gibbsiella quercinecans]RLM04640.1 glutathione S-transferase [Gibbsiella quercinecans]RLM09505.1 glutathione S-transferase [Gibbsiella quercinecans]TCT92320.1 glutathione S-transferase [Gibbsiella quercinecans]